MTIPQRIQGSLGRLGLQPRAGIAVGIAVALVWLLSMYVGQIKLLGLGVAALAAGWIIFRYPILGAMAAAFAVTFNLAFYWPKAIQCLLLLTLAAMIARKIMLQQPTWRVTPFGVWTGLLFVWLAVTGAWLPNYSFIGFGLQIPATAIVIVFLDVVENPRHLRAVILAAIAGGIATGLLSVYEIFHVVKSGYAAQGNWAVRTIQHTRYFGNWISSNPMAYSMMVVVAFAVSLLHGSQKRAINIFAVLAIIVGLTAVLISLCRGALFSTFLVLLLYFRTSKHRVPILTAVLAALLLVTVVLPVSVFARMDAILHGHTDSSISERGKLLDAGLDMVAESFPLGSGIGTYYRTSVARLVHRPYAIGSHNSYIDIVGEAGLMGLILFAGMIWALFNATKARTVTAPDHDFARSTQVAFRAGLIAIMIGMLTENMIGFPTYWLFFTIASLHPAIFTPAPETT